MNIYKLSIDDFTYDGYDWFIVVAKSRQDAIKYILSNKPDWDEGIDIWKTAKIEYIWKTNKKKNEIILESFNAW